MAGTKYGNLIVTELTGPQHMLDGLEAYKKIGKRVLWLDSGVVPGAFQMNCSWYLHPNDNGPKAHAHDCGELLGFYSNDPDNPYDLGAEIEFWMEDEKFIIDRSALVYIPPGVKHCPLILRRVNKPIFHFSVVTAPSYEMTDEGWVDKPAGGYRDYIVTELRMPEEKKRIAPEYSKYANRILWMDENVVPGAFHINTSWFFKAAPALEDRPHVHELDDEIIGFFGCDDNDPSNLNGEIEIWLGDEMHLIDKSAMIFVPRGLPHCPLVIRRADKPIFHFTVVPRGHYIKKDQ